MTRRDVALPAAGGNDTLTLPAVVDRATWQAERDALLVREKAHTREGDAIAAAPRTCSPGTCSCWCATCAAATGFETYRTTGRGVEMMAPSYGLLDRTVHGRQETREDSPADWPQGWRIDGEQLRADGRPTAQWSRLESGRSDDLGTASR